MNKSCLQCDKTFEKSRNESRLVWETRHLYCSRACASSAMRKVKVCSYCEKEFSGRGKQFCSRHCSGKSNGFQVGSKAHPKAIHNLVRIPYKKGHTPWNKGIVWEALRGENHPNWKGGKKKSKNGHMLSYKEYRAYKDWQKAVFTRDKWDCQLCGNHGGELHADHIKPWIAYPELRYDINNGRALCPPCHRKTDTYGKKLSYYQREVAA